MISISERLRARQEPVGDGTGKWRKDGLCQEAADEIQRYEELLFDIKQWCDAFPLKVFPEPDLKRARQLLEAGGMTLDAVSASNMRHVLKGVRAMIDRALKDEA